MNEHVGAAHVGGRRSGLSVDGPPDMLTVAVVQEPHPQHLLFDVFSM
jgi:hypothetical protein